MSLAAADHERYWPGRDVDAHERVNTIAYRADSDKIVISLRNPLVEQLHITALYTQLQRGQEYILC